MNRSDRQSSSTSPTAGDYVHFSGISSLSVHQSGENNASGWVSEMNFIRADTPSQLRQRFMQIQVTDQRFKEPTWMHPNIGGEAQFVQGHASEIATIHEELQDKQTKNKLGEWTSTSISGNAILSSVLFSAGQTIAKAGKLAPVTQFFVVVVVYCLRWVFEEVMSAVPLNGGFYTAMLNSASKKVAATAAVFTQSSNVFMALFLGYGTAMLGVTGFESSSQYVEEQAAGMFPKTLRNMWALSSTFNVAYSFLALAVVPLDTIIANQSTLLSYMGRLSGGRWLEILVAIDAFGVLAGAVLTAFVGINGLFQRLAIDRVLPSILLRTNSCRGTNHFIILSFFIVTASLVFILDAQVNVLSGVFALAFLTVLASFTVACLLLKVCREEIPRARSTSWTNMIFCLCMLALGILANAFSDMKALAYFVIYFTVFFSVVLLMLTRFSRGQGFVGSVMVAKTIETIKNTPVVFFCKAANLPKINEAVSYVMQNEHTYCLRLVHVCEPDAPVPREFEDVVNLFDHIYPLIKIDFIAVTGVFDPAMVQWLSKSMAVPVNMMFMRQPANANIHR
ncbi:hypothetical protein JM16_009703, partial [Phytophthora kernoviae]